PPQHPAAATFLQPRGREREPSVRTLTTAKDSLYFSYKITQPGEYIFRVRAYGQAGEKEPPRIALLLDVKQLATHQVKSTDEKKSGSYEASVTLKEGEFKAEVTMLNPSGGDKPRTLFVRRFEMEGPKDTYPPSHRKIMDCDPRSSHPEQTRHI